ncbi:unnamed protein product [Camellia sinensis]
MAQGKGGREVRRRRKKREREGILEGKGERGRVGSREGR